MKREMENPNTPIFGTEEEASVAPKYELPAHSMPGEVAYQMVHDEAMMDGNTRLNLATFVTTWMDDYARRVMTENMDKNMIDKTEYPQTAEIERRCVNMIAKLWNSPEDPYCTGTSTVGSSEACMLGALSALKRWQKRRRAKGLPTDKPNFIISTCMQVVWEKFAIYWDVEMRMVPVTADKITLDPHDVVAMCDENTICVVPIQGVTITGLNDNVKAINDALDKLNREKGWEICIHVDAATGGFIHPFIDPKTEWDFRLKWVLSIRMEGYHKIQQNCINVCLYLREELKQMGIFEFLSDEMPNPLFVWKLKEEERYNWTLYDLSDRLRLRGWQVPAYSMPKDMEEVVIMRVVIRQGFGGFAD